MAILMDLFPSILNVTSTRLGMGGSEWIAAVLDIGSPR